MLIRLLRGVSFFVSVSVCGPVRGCGFVSAPDYDLEIGVRESRMGSGRGCEGRGNSGRSGVVQERGRKEEKAVPRLPDWGRGCALFAVLVRERGSMSEGVSVCLRWRCRLSLLSGIWIVRLSVKWIVR